MSFSRKKGDGECYNIDKTKVKQVMYARSGDKHIHKTNAQISKKFLLDI